MNNGNMPANPVKGCDGTFIDDNKDNAQWLKQCKPSIGLTKREAFAMAAMKGLLAQSGFPTSINGVDICEYGLCASAAVQQADALLKELSK